VNVDEKSQKLENWKWNPNKEHVAGTGVCPLSNGTAHRIAISTGATMCLGKPRCDPKLIAAFFANGGAIGKTSDATGREQVQALPAPQPTRSLAPTNGKVHHPPPDRREEPDLLRRSPPQDIEAEQSVLGAVLLENGSIEEANRILKPEHFYREAHREIFKAMRTLWRDKVPIDAITLTTELRNRKKLEEVGGPAYLAELATVVPTARNVAHYSNIVKSKATTREIAMQATQIATLAYDGVSADALMGEALRLLTPVVETDGRPQLPQLIDRQIEVRTSREFHMQHVATEKRNWIVDGFLARKEISLWSGKVEAGKTTLMRTLVMCLARGEMFLERHTYPSRILYVMLDADGAGLTHDEFECLGWQPETDDVHFIVDPVMALRPHSFETFHSMLLALKPQFVVIDPLGRFQKIADFTGYETTYAMAQFSELAQQTDCHIALLHHIPRGRDDSADTATAGFGSIAIAGGCNARFVCTKKTGGIYTLQTSRGKGGGFRPFEGEQVLQRDETTHWVTLRGTYDWKEQARAVRPQVLEAVNQSEEWMSAQELARIIGVKRSIAGSAAKGLAQDGEIQLKIVKGNKHLFLARERQADLTNQSPND
jgi:hypothetical protein